MVNSNSTYGQYDETKTRTQIIIICVALAFCVIIFVLVLFKISHQRHEKRELNKYIVRMSLAYIIFCIFACLYELLYRFSVDISQCKTSDIIQEILICVARSILLIYYVVINSVAFNNERATKISQTKMCILYSLIIIHLCLPALYIPYFKIYPIKLRIYGVYCFNDLIATRIAFIGIILYQSFDAFITILLGGIFIYKLNILSKLLSRNALEKKQIINTLWCQFMCISISIVSSWIIILLGRLDGSNDSWLRWIYPLDYVFNVLCVYSWLRLENGTQVTQQNKDSIHTKQILTESRAIIQESHIDMTITPWNPNLNTKHPNISTISELSEYKYDHIISIESIVKRSSIRDTKSDATAAHNDEHLELVIKR